MMKTFLCLFIILVFNIANSQTFKLTGKVQDIKTGRGLSFATIKIIDGGNSTTSDNNGDYILKLENGYYKLITSYIGYFSDTESVYVENTDITRDIFLKSTEIFTEEIEVLGEDPAYEIIRKAIKYKKEFMKNLDEYNYDAFSKFIIRTNIPEEVKDTTEHSGKLPIMGILESETKGYFKKPDLEKQIVKSKRETANITRGVAIPLIVNFYDEKIDLDEIKIPGPVSDDALDDYEYKLLATTSMDSTRVFKIKVTNTSNIAPQFFGTIYIIDSSFALIKVDLQTNNAGNLRGIDKLNFIQKFSNFTDKKKNKFWMPTDVEILAEGSFLGLVKFQGEVYTVVSNYNLNEKAPPGTFNDIVVKILPDASKKDSLYWAKNQLIKNSNEEIKTFRKIEKDVEKKDNSFSLNPFYLNYGKNLSLSLFDIYRFNRIEGSQLKTKINYSLDFNRINASAFYAYGFSDKKCKYELNTSFRLLNDKSLRVTAGVYNRLNTLFRDPPVLSIFENTLTSLFSKKDDYNYFYEKGFNFSLSKRIIPQLGLTASYNETKQISAFKNTEYSFFRKSDTYSENPLINDAFKRTIGFSLRIDPNIYQGIDWGTGEISRFPVTEYPSLIFGFDYSGKKLNSTYENRTFSLNISGHHNFNSFININYRAGGILRTGDVPYQDLAYFYTTFLGFAETMSFYTMDYNEYLGDKLYYLHFENNFGKLLWGNLPVLKSFNLITFVNLGRSELSNSNYNFIASKNFSVTNGIFTEAGFGIDRIFDFIRLNFAWRLNNYKDDRNFTLSLTLQ